MIYNQSILTISTKIICNDIYDLNVCFYLISIWYEIQS